MQARRIAALVVLLPLVAQLAPAAPDLPYGNARSGPPGTNAPPPLPGENAVSALRITNKSGIWSADFDYFFTGAPYTAALSITLTPQVGGPPGESERYETFLRQPERGAHHMSAEIRYPGDAVRTLKAAVTMRSEMFSTQVLSSQQLDQVIDWPDFQTWMRDQLVAKMSPQDNFNRAVSLIDTDGDPQLKEARAILEKLIANDPKFAPAYVELARVAMKSNWGPAGLHQAESLLSSALQIQPDSANAKILLGYVFAHQNRFDQAERTFDEVARAQTPNLWLWSNWGELLTMEGKPDLAIIKYRQAISHPMTHDTYDRARAFAYDHLLELLRNKNDFDQMEVLYKQQVADFGPGSCYSADYTRFLLEVRGNAQAAIDLATKALNQSCDDAVSRELLGVAEYLKWSSTTGVAQAEALNQARIYLPPGPRALYLLARSDRTAPVAKALAATGEDIDQVDNDNMNALGYALQARETRAAARLLELGAKPEALVGNPSIPVAFLPVLAADAEGVHVLRKHGVDYSRLRYQGVTAFEIAKGLGSRAVLDALGGRERTL